MDKKPLMAVFGDNEVMIREGDRSDELFKILSGKAALYLHFGEENEYFIGVLSEGKCFGEVSLLAGKPSPYTAVTVSDTMVMRIPSDRFESFITQSPRNIADIMKNMANSIIMLKANVGMISEELNEIIKELEKDKSSKELADSIRQRLARYNLSWPQKSSIFSEKA